MRFPADSMQRNIHKKTPIITLVSYYLQNKHIIQN